MADERFSVLHITPGTQTTGWCNNCLLPSVLHVPLHVVGDSGVQHIGTYHGCTECGERPQQR